MTAPVPKPNDRSAFLEVLIEGLNSRAFRTEALEDTLIRMGESSAWDPQNEHEFRCGRAAAAYLFALTCGLSDALAVKQARAEFATCKGERK